jgi:hypothetical protein
MSDDTMKALEDLYWGWVDFLMRCQQDYAEERRNGFADRDWAYYLRAKIDATHEILGDLEHIIWNTIPRVICECGTQLKVSFDSAGTISVEPCPECEERISDETYQEGYSVPYNSRRGSTIEIGPRIEMPSVGGESAEELNVRFYSLPEIVAAAKPIMDEFTNPYDVTVHNAPLKKVPFQTSFLLVRSGSMERASFTQEDLIRADWYFVKRAPICSTCGRKEKK